MQQLAAIHAWSLLLLALSLTRRTPAAIDLPADRADHLSLTCEQKGKLVTGESRERKRKAAGRGSRVFLSVS